MAKNRWMIAGICLALCLLDQWTKALALAHLTWNQPLVLNPFFALTLVGNKGVSFGIFSHWPPQVLMLLTSLLVMGFGFAFFRTQERIYIWIYGLVVSGAIGNWLDRMRFGFVIDFVDLSIHPYHWPAFNVADMMISVAAGLIVMDALHKRRKLRTNQKNEIKDQQ